jgi:hypothetical protein
MEMYWRTARTEPADCCHYTTYMNVDTGVEEVLSCLGPICPEHRLCMMCGFSDLRCLGNVYFQ